MLSNLWPKPAEKVLQEVSISTCCDGRETPVTYRIVGVCASNPRVKGTFSTKSSQGPAPPLGLEPHIACNSSPAGKSSHRSSFRNAHATTGKSQHYRHKGYISYLVYESWNSCENYADKDDKSATCWRLKHRYRELNRVTRQELDLDLVTAEYHAAKQPFSLP